MKFRVSGARAGRAVMISNLICARGVAAGMGAGIGDRGARPRGVRAKAFVGTRGGFDHLNDANQVTMRLQGKL